MVCAQDSPFGEQAEAVEASELLAESAGASVSAASVALSVLSIAMTPQSQTVSFVLTQRSSIHIELGSQVRLHANQ